MPKGVYDRYPPEILEYMKAHASPELTRHEMREMIQRELGYTLTADYIKGVYLRNRLPSARPLSGNAMFTKEQSSYLISIIPGRSSAEIAEMMNRRFCMNVTPAQIHTWKKNHRLSSGYDTKFRPGQLSRTKGMKWDDFMSAEAQERSRKTQFRKGNIPANHKPIGAISKRRNYLWIKVQDGHGVKNWKMLQQYVWENAHGPVPEGWRIMFRDQNTLNCELTNLTLVKASVLATANVHIGMTGDPDLNDAIVKAVELKMRIADIEKENKK